MKRFLNRVFRFKPIVNPEKPGTCHHSDSADESVHAGFKTKPGQGPFMRSFDGRVIPLRKARFLLRK